MADLFSASVESAELIAMFGRLAQSADFVTREVGRDTAKRIVAEAQRRVKRATGKTAEGIHWELTRDGKGYIVLAYEAGRQPPVDIYLEFGTRYVHARSFFFGSARLEEGSHLRRLTEEVQRWLNDVGR